MPYNSQWTGQQIDDAIGKVRDNTVNASAVNVSFTPGDSGLGSTNVQDALEELAGRPSGGGSPRTYRVVVGTSTAGGQRMTAIIFAMALQTKPPSARRLRPYQKRVG